MDSNLTASLDFVFSVEGGFIDNPADPGGATNFGITLRELQQWRQTPVTVSDVAALTRAEAQNIYMARYWNVMRGGDLPGGIDLLMLDTGVNLGTSKAARLLQACLQVACDGCIGPQTLAALRAHPTAQTIAQLSAARSDFYRTLPDFPQFGEGWLNRVARAQAQALLCAQAGHLA